MNITIKPFNELAPNELWSIYEIRSRVFVVDQNCAYQDVDVHDQVSYHIAFSDTDGVQGYARVLPAHTTFDEVSIGRVISLKRRNGLGTQVLQCAMEVAKEKFQARKIVIEAQLYAIALYEKQGFRTVGEEFLEDGIPHIKMVWEA